MREKLIEVLELQHLHSSENTPEMARRGHLVRTEIAEELRQWPCTRADALLPFRGRVAVQGKDGTGRKTFVPWVRIFCPELSPSAQTGWYVVYLFHADGSTVSLCLSHGSTRWDGVQFQPRSPAEAASLMNWARGKMGDQAKAIGMDQGVDLGSVETLSKAYESTTAFSKSYSFDGIPSDAELAGDALAAVGLLGEVYQEWHLGRAPTSTPPEIVTATELAEHLARPNRKVSGGQGFGLNAAERAVVEAHAMQSAHDWLSANGYANIRDVHRTHSCDYLANKGDQEFHVEVKGTTAGLGSILLTANEVALHEAKHPHNTLVVVHDIELLPLRVKAAGGTVTAFQEWDIKQTKLRPLSYQCFLV